MSADILGCHNLGRGCYWHLVNGGQGCCQTPYNSQGIHTTKNCPASNVNRADIEKPCFNIKWVKGEVQIKEVAIYNTG